MPWGLRFAAAVGLLCASCAAPDGFRAPADRDSSAQPPPGADGAGEAARNETGTASGVRSTPETYFRHHGINPTIDTQEESVSSFALDVDTASYTLARSLLTRGELPDPAAIRVEEFVNYFDYGYETPEPGEPFATHLRLVSSPTRPDYHLLVLGLEAKELDLERRKPSNIVFVVDGSGSMGRDGRLALVQDGLRLLTEVLDHRDRVSIVTYGSSAMTVLPPTPGDRTPDILAAIEALEPEGTTNIEAGLQLAFELATKTGPDGRVVICSDGVANTGSTDAEALLRAVDRWAETGMSVTAVGVGMGHYNDALLEAIAARGGGYYAYVDREEEARRVFVEALMGRRQVVARDARLQIEFDGAEVARYRLLGYENTLMGPDEFAGDGTGSGDIGAGHSVTALYELELHEPIPARLGTLRLRYRDARGKLRRYQRELEPMPLPALDDGAAATMLAVVVAEFAEKLRGSYWVEDLRWEDLLAMYRALPAQMTRRKEVAELGQLLSIAAELSGEAPGARSSESGPSRVDFARIQVLK